jgi:F-type H+-transporting ATPase subunit alpha
MPDSAQHIADFLQKQIALFQPEVTAHEVGAVLEAGDGIARVSGLSHVFSQELLQFADGTIGIAFDLEAEQIGVIIMGDYGRIEEGMEVRATGRIASIPVGDGLIGRVVNALGEPVDGRGPVASERYRPVERIAPHVIERQDVDTPVQTGLKAIDSMIPIGRGQRELIIGDRQTGKSAIAIDTIINQKGKGLICVYVAIGQKKSSVARTVDTLARHGAMDHTVVVLAAADEPAVLQYIAPYAGCAIGEEIMESGRDALIVYDDLSKHAWAYRQVSLLLRRPPGREAYPGDVFYLHSRLLERAARLADRYVIVPAAFSGDAGEQDAADGKTYGGPRGRADAERALADRTVDSGNYKIAKVKGSGGSLSALPIIETLLGDVSAYIPTNIISITDGQIYLESNLFYTGIRPAVNVGISVSRVGGDAQTRAMKQVAGRLRLNMAQFRELAAFAQFGSDLDKATQTQLDRGQHLQEILKQPQYEPMALGHQVAVLYAGVNGMIDSVPLDKVQGWEEGFHHFLAATHGALLETIEREAVVSAESEAELKSAIVTYNASWH